MDRVESSSAHFPSFSEGLSLRIKLLSRFGAVCYKFPFLFGGTFIEEFSKPTSESLRMDISLPFRRDFH